jgi:hypothetical protein
VTPSVETNGYWHICLYSDAVYLPNESSLLASIVSDPVLPNGAESEVPARAIAQLGRGERKQPCTDAKLPGVIQELRTLRSRACSEVSP